MRRLAFWMCVSSLLSVSSARAGIQPIPVPAPEVTTPIRAVIQRHLEQIEAGGDHPGLRAADFELADIEVETSTDQNTDGRGGPAGYFYWVRTRSSTENHTPSYRCVFLFPVAGPSTIQHMCLDSRY